MKYLALILAACSLAFSSLAQTIIPPLTGTNAITTNGLSFTNVTLELYTGYGYVSGANTASQAKTGLSWGVWSGFGPTVEIANEATGNVIAEMDAFFEYRHKVNGFELHGGIGGGYNWDTSHPKIGGVIGINYNLTHIGQTFEYIGNQDELMEELHAKSGRPAASIMFIGGVGFP